MCKKLIYLVSSVLVLGLTIGVAEAAFDTVGVYDPDDDPHHNQVDQSGVYDSHTGNAGPENVIDLATFQALIGPAFDADAGGVVDAESERGSRDGQDIIANFGVSRAKSVTFADTTGNLTRGSGGSDGNRLPTSGNGRFSKAESPPDWVFDISPVTGGVPGEVVTYFAGTLLYRDNRELNPQVTATFSGGGTVTAIADMPMGAPGHSKDTFFGFVAPRGEGIVNVNFDLIGWTNLDDVAFITSAFVVALKEASDPKPANEATDVPRDAVLGWTPGQYAPPVNGHTVYLSDNFNDVNDSVGGIAQDANSYAPGRLAFGTTYYWRVDEVNGPPDYAVYEGGVWSFTTEPVAYAIGNIIATASSSGAGRGPENTINGSGLDDSGLLHGKDGDNNMWLSGATGPQPTWIEFQFDNVYKLHEMWVWNYNEFMEPVLGLGCKDVFIEYSVDGTDYTPLGATHEFARAPGVPDYEHNTTIDFGGAAAKYVRLTANSNWGGLLNQYGLSEVRFFHIPVNATEPSPDSGTTDVAVDVTLGFRTGREAAKHNVYLSTDEQTVIDGTAPVTTVTESGYGPLALDLGKTYYWKINEVNEAETPTTWESDLWSFTTQEYFVVDDIESYNDLDPDDPESNRIFNVWIDGYGIATNGSLVGYDAAPFAEQTIVHSDKQSMPFFYNNTGGAAYSEAGRTFAAPQNWTKAGVATLVLYFHGTAGSTGQLYVKINDAKVAYDGDVADIATLRWKQWNIDLAPLGANLQNVTKLSIGIDGSGATGKLYFDDFRLYRLAPEIVVPSEEIWIEAESAATITEPMKIYDDPAASGGKYIGTDDGIGNQSSNPPPDGIATYNFTVAGGTYKISGRINIPGGSNSFWVRIQGATIPAETEIHSSGWVRWNDAEDLGNWFWNDVFSDDDDQDATVLFTMPAGTYTLEIARREDGAMLDVIVISKID